MIVFMLLEASHTENNLFQLVVLRHLQRYFQLVRKRIRNFLVVPGQDVAQPLCVLLAFLLLSWFGARLENLVTRCGQRLTIEPAVCVLLCRLFALSPRLLHSLDHV